MSHDITARAGTTMDASGWLKLSIEYYIDHKKYQASNPLKKKFSTKCKLVFFFRDPTKQNIY